MEMVEGNSTESSDKHHQLQMKISGKVWCAGKCEKVNEEKNACRANAIQRRTRRFAEPCIVAKLQKNGGLPLVDALEEVIQLAWTSKTQTES
jgi:hypothetical protein